MKKIMLAATALVAFAAPALAADMAVKAPAYAAPMVPIYNWTGIYVGGNVGGAFRDSTIGGNDARFIGGGQVGADYQFSGSWLVGIEANYDFVGNGDGAALAFPGGTFNQNLRGLASVTGRGGFTWGPGLIYFKGGYAYADMRDTGVGPFLFNDRRDGYTLGGGFEYMFAQNWSGKIEYQFYDFGRRQLFTGAPLVPGPTWREEEHTIKVGLNYHFNFLNPLTPRY